MSNEFADISSNNPEYNAAAYASGGYVAVMLKATEDDNYHNPFYSVEHGGRDNWARDSHRQNLPVFHYHFARPEHGNPGGQMEWFWSVVKPHFRWDYGDRVIIDLETGDPRSGASWLREADSHLKAISGTHPWAYTYLSYFLSGGVTISSKNMHIAAFGSRRPGDFRWRLPFGMNLAAWQHTDRMSHHGIGGLGDGSVLNPAIYRQELKRRRQHPLRKHK